MLKGKCLQEMTNLPQFWFMFQVSLKFKPPPPKKKSNYKQLNLKREKCLKASNNSMLDRQNWLLVQAEYLKTKWNCLSGLRFTKHYYLLCIWTNQQVLYIPYYCFSALKHFYPPNKGKKTVKTHTHMPNNTIKRVQPVFSYYSLTQSEIKTQLNFLDKYKLLGHQGWWLTPFFHLSPKKSPRKEPSPLSTCLLVIKLSLLEKDYC